MHLARLELAAHVRACVSGDWLVLLDLRGDRYWALPTSMPEAQIEAKLRERALLSGQAKSIAELRAPKPKRAMNWGKHWPDTPLMFACGLWAAHIVKHGKLEAAFAWFARHKIPAPKALSGIGRATAEFRRRRAWLPWPYVCLFNALCLGRFLAMRGYRFDFVVGVRVWPFSAHCWLETEGGVILDAGGEACETFTQIARV